MSDKSAIEWTDATWNPVTGCTKVSPGCDNCYAETFAERWRGIPGHHYEQGFDLRLWPDRLDIPLRWKRPRRIFVNSMSDLFHKDIPDDFILAVFEIMFEAKQHTFQVLTKRPERLKRWVARHSLGGNIPPHIWLGVSVEGAEYKWRIDMLRETPAAVRFLSIEPLLGDVGELNLDGIHWVIIGGESGHNARPMHPDWARSVRDQCVAAGVPFFYKQTGEWGNVAADVATHVLHDSRGLYPHDPRHPAIITTEPGVNAYLGGHWVMMKRIGKAKAGRLLDGREWNEFPKAVAC